MGLRGKMKVFLFGSGINAKTIMSLLKSDVKIQGFIDNDSEKWGAIFQGYTIYSVEILPKIEYDYIVISVQRGYEEIKEQLLRLGVLDSRIVIPFSFDRSRYSSWQFLFNMGEFVRWEMGFQIEKLKLEIENAKYELAEEIYNNRPQIPNIKGFDETIDEIVKQGKSISRYGDGEFDLILGRDNTLQKRNVHLAGRLVEILNSNLNNHIVAIPNVYGAFDNRTEEFKECFRKHLSNGGREREYALLDMDKVYYDAFISRPYKDYVNKSESAYKFARLKEIWKDRDVTIVEGKKTRMGVGNDLYDGVRSCNRILCPVVNAYDYYDEIIKAVEETSDCDRLIMIALGATATVLAYDLSQMGYQAVDIGHIDIEYEWFVRNSLGAKAIEGKYTNEAPGGRIVSDDIIDDKYRKEIVRVIG